MRPFVTLLLILLAAATLRMPGIGWGQVWQTDYTILQPDEFQHLHIAIDLLRKWDAEAFPDFEPFLPKINTPGLGTQIAAAALLLPKTQLDQRRLVLLGRGISLAYSLVTLLLVYWLGRLLFSTTQAGLWAAGCLAIFDLPATYAHYAIPETAHVFFAYLTLLGVFAFDRRQQPVFLLLAGLGAAGAMVMKYDFLPLFISGLFLATRSRQAGYIRFLYLLLTVACAVAGWYWLTLGQFSTAAFRDSFFNLMRENRDIVAGDYHWLLNPPLYAFALLAGSSFLAGYFAVKGFKGKSSPNVYRRWMLAWMLLECLPLWSMDVLFVRRLLVFFPALALWAGHGAQVFFKANKKGLVVVAAVYTLVLTMLSQSNFWWDTRYAARAYLSANAQPGQTLGYSPAAKVAGMMPANGNAFEAEWLVWHESYYSRFGKSFATPFGMPECCAEVYHCWDGEAVCTKYQQILAGRDPDYRLEKRFSTREWMPERILYKSLFGTYETFLGDVLIFFRLQT